MTVTVCKVIFEFLCAIFVTISMTILIAYASIDIYAGDSGKYFKLGEFIGDIRTCSFPPKNGTRIIGCERICSCDDIDCGDVARDIKLIALTTLITAQGDYIYLRDCYDLNSTDLSNYIETNDTIGAFIVISAIVTLVILAVQWGSAFYNLSILCDSRQINAPAAAGGIIPA